MSMMSVPQNLFSDPSLYIGNNLPNMTQPWTGFLTGGRQNPGRQGGAADTPAATLPNPLQFNSPPDYLLSNSPIPRGVEPGRSGANLSWAPEMLANTPWQDPAAGFLDVGAQSRAIAQAMKLSTGLDPNDPAQSTRIQQDWATNYQNALQQTGNPYQAQLMMGAPNALDLAGGGATPAPLQGQQLLEMLMRLQIPGVAAGGTGAYAPNFANPGPNGAPSTTPAGWLPNQMPGATPVASPGFQGTPGAPGSFVGPNGQFDWNAFLSTIAGGPGGTPMGPPGAPGGPAGPSTASFGGPASSTQTVDEWLAGGVGDTNYLHNFAANNGLPTDALPAWQAMVDAQQRNQQQRFADLTSAFGVSGNRFSTAFGDAAADYWNQAGRDQNALLGQMSLASMEAGRGRQFGAAQQLGSQAFQGASQLSSQDFQSLMQQMGMNFGAAQGLFGSGTNAAAQLAQLGAQGAMALLGGSITGTQGLYGTEVGGMNNEIQRQLMLQQLGLGAAGNLSNLWQQNLNLGGQLGGQQYGIGNAAIQAQYQEWLRQQPQYNPLLPYMYGGATGYPPAYYPQYQPSSMPGTLGGIGAILAGLPGLLKLFGIGAGGGD